MSVSITLSANSDGSIAVRWPSRTTVVSIIDELRDLLNEYTQLDPASMTRIGIAAVLFAARGLQRAGTALTRSNILRALDEQYFILADDLYHHRLTEGIEMGVSAMLSSPSAWDGELRRVLEAT